jgi:hypothetical protein
MKKMQKSAILFTVFSLIFFSTAAFAYAINDVSITDLTNFNLLTADTAAPVTITANAGGLVTNLDVQAIHMDITINNLSIVTFNTIIPGNYLKITQISGSTAFTLTPACPTTTATVNGTGAQTVLRLQVYTTDQCATTTTPPAGGSGGAGGRRENTSTTDQIGLAAPELIFGSPFTDISGHWAEQFINNVYQQGYIEGYSDSTFRPDQNITRAESAKLIALWFDNNIADDACDSTLYNDVSCSEWYGKYITYLTDKGVLQGYGDGLFLPGKTVTRAEALKMMMYAKAQQYTDVTDITNPFSDVIIGQWFYHVVLVGYKLNIVQGYNDGTFRPFNSVTRAEYTKMFNETFL